MTEPVAQQQAKAVAQAISDKLDNQGPQVVYLIEGVGITMVTARSALKASNDIHRIYRTEGEDALGYYIPTASFKQLWQDVLSAHEVNGWPMKLGPWRRSKGK